MRESKTFAKRTKALKSDEPIKKFFLVCEGEKTEIIYFNSLQKFSYKLGINPSIEMIPIIRSYSETGWSNPKKIIDTLIKKLEENDLKKMSYDALLNEVMNHLKEKALIVKHKISEKVLWTTLNKTCIPTNKTLDDEVEDIDSTKEIISKELKKI